MPDSHNVGASQGSRTTRHQNEPRSVNITSGKRDKWLDYQSARSSHSTRFTRKESEPSPCIFRPFDRAITYDKQGIRARHPQRIRIGPDRATLPYSQADGSSHQTRLSPTLREPSTAIIKARKRARQRDFQTDRASQTLKLS